jgi:predicted MFS family arabinose efflux permease
LVFWQVGLWIQGSAGIQWEEQEENTGDRARACHRGSHPIFALFGANAASQVGNMMIMVAVPWFVLETTGSAARVGLTAAAVGVGAVVPAVLGGPLVDWLGFRRASVLTDLASAATVAAIPLLYLVGVLAFWQLLVLVFVLSSLNSNGDSARFALIPALARRATMPIERANSADRAIVRLGAVLGPPLAGVLIALIGASNVLFVDAVTFSVSAALVALGVSSTASADAQAEAERERAQHAPRRHGGQLFGHPARFLDPARQYLSELLEGLRFVRTNALILSMILIATVTNFLDVPLLSVIMPIYAKTVYDSTASLGIVLKALGAGTFAGTLLFGAVGHRLPSSRRLTFFSCFVAAPLIIFTTLAATLPLAIVVTAGTLGGLFAGPINPLYETVIQENTPLQMLGRIFGTLNALAQAGIPLGAALAGFVVEGLGLVLTILGMGAIYLAVTVGMFFNPALRQMDAGKER